MVSHREIYSDPSVIQPHPGKPDLSRDNKSIKYAGNLFRTNTIVRFRKCLANTVHVIATTLETIENLQNSPLYCLGLGLAFYLFIILSA